MKKLILVLEAVLALALVAKADELTFTVVGPGAISGGPGGMAAGPAMVTMVTDVTTGKSIALTDHFTASAGAATSITTNGDNYTGFFGHGAAGSVNIPSAVTGNMLGGSELTAADEAGSFSGEFDVTFLSPVILKEFGLGPKWAPTGSVGITFHESAISGQSITGLIGGGSTTVLTVTTVVPEPATWAMFLFGLGTLAAFWQAKQNGAR